MTYSLLLIHELFSYSYLTRHKNLIMWDNKLRNGKKRSGLYCQIIRSEIAYSNRIWKNSMIRQCKKWTMSTLKIIIISFMSISNYIIFTASFYLQTRKKSNWVVIFLKIITDLCLKCSMYKIVHSAIVRWFTYTVYRHNFFP